MAKAGRKSTLFDFRGLRSGATIRGRPVLFGPPDPLDELREELRELQLQLKSAGKPPPKGRRVVQPPQGSRVEVKLAEVYGDRVPSRKEEPDSVLVDKVTKAFENEPKKTRLPIPHPKTILRAAGRIPRKK